MAEETSPVTGAMWALVTLIIVLLVIGILWFSGAFSNRKTIDINIDKPGLVMPAGHLR